MFRIRKISNPYLEVNLRAMDKVRQIIREQFPDIREEKISEVSEELVDPLKYKYQTALLIADDINETIRGFALLAYMPDLEFCFLDFLAVSPGKTSSGVGGTLYERLREEAEALGAIGIFFECLPDDPALYKDQKYLLQNKTRLAFYERYGARPLANTLYETPVNPDEEGAPYLVFDGLGLNTTIPKDRARQIVRAILERNYGDYCLDTFTPLNKNAFLAARWGVNCTLTAATEILEGTRSAYVLTRPPGHHAEKKIFGGFCYFNNCAIAANYLATFGKVAILDIDYHHGNGQQQIFYPRNDVLTVSIHGHPSFAYPYFSGFRDEKGKGKGLGFNINYPLAEDIDPDSYHLTLAKALDKIRSFAPEFLIVALGFDTAKGDPTGTWRLSQKHFEQNGALIGRMKLPTLIIQEGGYRHQALGSNAKAFFTGFFRG